MVYSFGDGVGGRGEWYLSPLTLCHKVGCSELSRREASRVGPGLPWYLPACVPAGDSLEDSRNVRNQDGLPDP